MSATPTAAPKAASPKSKRFVPPRGEPAKRYAEQVAVVVAGMRPGPTPCANVVASAHLARAAALDLQASLRQVEDALVAEAKAASDAGRRHQPPPLAAMRLLGNLRRKAGALIDVLGTAPEEAVDLFDALDARFPLPEGGESGTASGT